MQIRRPQFDLTQAPRFWNGGSPVRTHLLNAISVLLPHGEKFFVETAASARENLDDPVLRRQSAGFIAQESVHSNQHRQYNDEVAKLGYNVPFLEHAVVVQIKATRRVFSDKWKLAIVAAYEHLTGLMGHHLLTSPEWLEGAHSGFLALWHWHSVEEIEHKEVAFDLFRNAGGGYFMRVIAMIFATLGLLANLFWITTYFSIKDRSLFTWFYWTDWFSFTFWKSGFFGTLLRGYFCYFSPGFHPSHRDDSSVVRSWQKANP